MVWVFFVGLSCIHKYPMRDSVESIVEPRDGVVIETVDFAPIDKELAHKQQLITSREQLQKLQLLEDLILKARGWDIQAQRDVIAYAHQVLRKTQDREVMEIDTQEVDQVIDVEGKEIEMELSNPADHPYIEQAQKLVSEGHIDEALKLLERCQKEDCWGQVYVAWADIKDQKINLILEELLKKEQEGEAAHLLNDGWSQLIELAQGSSQSQKVNLEYQRYLNRTEQER